MNQDYMKGQFNFFEGQDGPPQNVEAPLSTGITGGITENDYDPVLLSYMGGTFANGKFSTPRALMSVVDTDLSPGGSGLSTGKYFVSTPNLAATPKITWSATGGPQGIRFVDDSDPFNPNPLLGNPYGLVQAGQYMHLNEYDNTNIYTIHIPSFEAAATDTYTIAANTDITDVGGHIPNPSGYVIKAASLSVLTDFSPSTPVSYLYAMYNYLSPASPTEPTTYLSAVIARFKLDSNGRIDDTTSFPPVYVEVGKNAQTMMPFAGGVDGITIAVGAIGGPQNYGTTNGSDSNVCLVPAFGHFHDDYVVTALVGDGGAPAPTGPAVTVNGNYDFKSIAISDDGKVFILIETEGANFRTWWRILATNTTALLASNNLSISDALASANFNELDSGCGSPGYYWTLFYENNTDPSKGRLWFAPGTLVRISEGADYDNFRLFDMGTLYFIGANEEFPYIIYINAADHMGEMIYQYNKGNSLDTRFLKGKSDSKNASIASAAPIASVASVAEEEEEGK
jgi:hypothetical protein